MKISKYLMQAIFIFIYVGSVLAADPSINGLPTDVTVDEDTLSNVNLSAATLTDPDSTSISLTIAAGAGTLTAGSGSGVIVAGSGTSTLTLFGDVTDIDVFLNTASNIQYTGPSNAQGNNVTTLTLTGDDGGGVTALGTVNVDITEVADVPSVTNAATDEDTQTTTGLVISRNVYDSSSVTHFKITNINGGVLYKNDGTTAIASNSFITFAEGNAGLKFTPTANSTSNGSFDVQAATDGVGGGLSLERATATITITPVNDAPVIYNLNGDGVIFNIGGYGVTLDASSNVTLSDIDSPDFNGGNVSVSIVASGYAAEDVLQIGSVGAISVFGSNVTHADSITIGTFAGGTNGTDLVITLNANATVARVRDLLSSLQYTNTNPTTVNTVTRTVRLTVDDGDGGNSTSFHCDVSVSLVYAPMIDLDGDDSSGATGGGYYGSFTENGGAVAAADTDSLIADDGTFKSITVTLNNRPDGTSESLSSTYGTGAQTVNSEAVTIGGYNSGTGILTIVVNDGSANATTMQMLMRSIRYHNTSDNPNTTDRHITYIAVDDADNAGPPSTAVITVAAVNDAPVITSDGGGASASVSMDENTAMVTTVTSTDIDSGDTHTYSISGGVDAARFTIDSNSGVLSFAVAPDYESPTDNGTDNIYDVQVAVTDSGQGNLTDTQIIAVSVNDVSENIVITGTPVTSLVENGHYSFYPTVSNLDTGETFSCSIINKPTWAQFDTATCALTGIPTHNDIGTTTGIVISAEDSGNTTASLDPFSILVVGDLDADGIGNNEDTDDDNDGISDEIESKGPNSGDANSDGIQDSLQSNVASIKVYDSDKFVILEAPDGVVLKDCQSADIPSSEDAPAGIQFKYGLFDFTITGIAAGGNTTLTMTLPGGAMPDTYYKYGMTPDNSSDHWYEFLYDGEKGAEINGNVITLHFTDALTGDDVLVQDGQIVDLGGPGFTTNNGGDGSSSCFIESLRYD